ncbi:MAG: endonuclease/exonuclease/phosphatase family protein [Planctomycetaceae bacterium]|jgi:endonuclease/exonuclease/phosphatase family metal-dependent hydrolase|nr:endonuclease/exonuclease/phosphatase family protein [Planctomycetaceae bacterium]
MREFTTCILVLFGLIIPADLSADEPVTLRVLSYNIHHGEGIDSKLDLERIAKVMLAVKPDIIAIQEVDHKTSRTQKIDQAEKLAKLTKMHVVFGPNIEFGGGSYGNAILSKYPIKKSQNHHLPNHEKGEQRGALFAEIKIPGVTGHLTFISTHFDHRPDDTERIASAKFVNQWVNKNPDQAVIIAGDFNDIIGSETLSILDKSWTRTNLEPMPTIPVKKPNLQIDFILSRPKSLFDTVETKVLDEAVASDHRAFFSVLKLKPNREQD